MGSFKTKIVICLLLLAQPVTGQNLLKYVTRFNQQDSEYVKNYIDNDHAYQWLSENIPLFECPDATIEQMYYYRWWTFRKHLKQTPDGFIFTEFIIPVKHAGRYNALSSAFGHQVYEGRWLIDKQYINQYIQYWFIKDATQKAPRFHQFSSWGDDAVYNSFLVNGDSSFVISLLPYMVTDYNQWVKEKRLPNGLFWQFDVKDGMEESISGSRKEKSMRPTINSYMYGNARAIAKVAAMADNDSLKRLYGKLADTLQHLTNNLWDKNAHFYKVRLAKDTLSNAREELGFIPWYFNIPKDDAAHAKAWEQLTDTSGFNAPWGITTAERRHPAFRSHGTGGCEWDGALWPFATTQTLKGLANLLTNYKHHINPDIYYNALHTYANSQQKNNIPYLGEYQDERTGYWLKGDNPRSSYYNHSGFCDLVISDLIGLKPRADNTIELNPLISKWDWFKLERVPYHGHLLTIRWDKTGTRYNKGKGLYILSDDKEIYHGDKLKHVIITKSHL
jgi:hypothetical protein